MTRRTPAQRLLRNVQRRYLMPLAGRWGFDLRPTVPEWEHRPLSGPEVERLLDCAAASLRADLAAAGLPGADGVESWVREFWNLIPHCPVRQKHGGNGFNGALQLFVLARALEPDVIVESGVFRGLTTWILRRARPDARIFSFDPVLDLHYRDGAVRYSRQDWSTASFEGVDLTKALAFFDDHVSQARRLVEAQERGIRHVALDDDAEAHRIHAHGGPAHPTLAMVLEDRPPGEPIRWRRNGLEFSCQLDPDLVARSRAAIEGAHGFDDLHRATGYSPSRLSYVRLRRP